MTINYRKETMKISDLGERKVIEAIISCLEQPQELFLPFGDDVSAVPIGRDRVAVLKTDLLVGATDIPPGMTLRQAARKAVVMNISDFAAKGVKPKVLLTSLGLPRDLTRRDVEEIGRGLNDGVREYDAYLIGGDTGEAADLIICCMVFGTSRAKRLIPRTGAHPGDILAVTGHFGKTAVGFKTLLEGFSLSEQEKGILDAVYTPNARLSEGLALSRTGAVSASIDSSDGLAVSLYELAKMSHVGFSLTEIPIAEEIFNFANRNQFDAIELALYGGEEYELVLTIKPEGWRKAEQTVRRVGGHLIDIGKVTENRRIVLNRDGAEMPIEYKGWEHFTSN